MTIYDRIRQRLDELDITPRAASLRVGTNAELIRKLLDEESDPRDSTVTKLAEALETTPEWLRTGTRSEAELRSGGRPPPVTLGFDLLAAVPVADFKGMMPETLPILGTAAGGMISSRGGFEIEPRVIDFAHRPPSLAGVEEAYAVRVSGHSMEPEHRHGALRFVNPRLRAMIGDSVIVTEKRSEADPPEAYIGHLLRRTASEIILGKLNPQSYVEFNVAYVVAVHKIMEMDDLFLS